MIKATIKFTETELAQEFILHCTGEGTAWFWPDQKNPVFKTKTWRVLAADAAIELVAICDAQADFVEMPRNFDRLEIWPVRWGYPDSLIQAHPVEVAQMEKDHQDGKHALADDTISWPDWLERFGKIELWAKFRTPEMERQWLSCRTLPGCTLSALAGFDSYIPRQVLGKIQFRADFHQGDKVTTIWLAQCAKSLLSDGEMRTLPGQVVEPSVPISVLGKKLDSLSADLKRIGDLKVEENYARDKWAENPLGSPEAVADYFLNMDVVKISRGVATALVRYGHGNTRKQCADEAGVSVATIKRALVKARQTPYAKFFARTRGQKLMARRSFKQLDEVYAWLRSMATANSEMLRSVVDQVIVKANAGDESGGANTWEKIVAELV